MKTAMIAAIIVVGNVILVDDPRLLLPVPVVVVGEPLPVVVVEEPLPVVVVEEPLPLGAPDPPATLESCANPIEGGSARKTEYTFFKKVSPTTQEASPGPGEVLLARPISMMAPMHCELPREIWPRFMSVTFIGHALPPKESVT